MCSRFASGDQAWDCQGFHGTFWGEWELEITHSTQWSSVSKGLLIMYPARVSLCKWLLYIRFTCEPWSHDLGLVFLTFNTEISSICFVELREERKEDLRKVQGPFASVSIQQEVNAHLVLLGSFSSSLGLSQSRFHFHVIFLIGMCLFRVGAGGGTCTDALC